MNRLVREHNVKFIIIDYLQLMNASGMRFGSREQEVSMISRSLKQLAKELNIPIVSSMLAMSFRREPTEAVANGDSSSSPQFSKRANRALKRSFTSSTEPERCLATINSARPRMSLPASS